MANKHELAWSGEAVPQRSGGFVDGVGLNQLRPGLAVDPDGTVIAEATGSHASGPKLDVQRLDEDEEGPVRPSGRVRLSRT